jgi:hypothetical protein
MRAIKVETHYAGSRMVIWLGRDFYIDVRYDVRTQGVKDHAEVVRNGQGIHHRTIGTIPGRHACPAYQVVKLIRDTLRGELRETDWKNPQPPLYANEVKGVHQ